MVCDGALKELICADCSDFLYGTRSHYSCYHGTSRSQLDARFVYFWVYFRCHLWFFFTLGDR